MSYARADGRRLALDLHQSIEAAGHSVWQDVFDMQGGEDWWLQIEEKIEHAKAAVLVVTPTAFESDIVRREWIHARRAGTHILPVAEDPKIFQDAPRWMSKVDVFVLAPESPDYDKARRRFHEQLRQPPPLRPVPITAPSLPFYLVRRESEHRHLSDKVLDATRQNPSFSTVIVYGPPGFGKTMLVQDVCHDPAVSEAFTGGILWANIGPGGQGVLSALNAMVTALSGRPVAFNTPEEAASRLDQLLEYRDCLLVLDDVWDEAHIKPFLGASRCARLITTRDPANCMPAGAIAEPVGEMLTVEAAEMLCNFLPPQALDEASGDCVRDSLTALARRLGESQALSTSSTRCSPPPISK